MDKILNTEQIRAIEHGTGPLLIIAGAGTGKTTVVVERVKHLISSGLAKPQEILALTFTEKAAQEMIARVDEALPYGYAQMWISTFHSFGDRILRDEAIQIGLSSRYKLMTEAECHIFLRQNLFKLDLEIYRPLGNPFKFINGLLQHFSRLKDEDISTADYLAWANKQEEKSYLELAQAFQKHEELKISEEKMDFSDLITATLRLFRERPVILRRYQEQFKFILVDEFQDTNYAQNCLANLLAGKNKNITVVGDDDQAVYRFRGASVSNILQFEKEYPQGQKVVLTQNYRSNQEILDKAYALIQFNNPDRLEIRAKVNKRLISCRGGVNPAPGTPTVHFLHADRVENEAEMVAKEIKFLVETQNFASLPIQYSDIAILVRANNHSEPFIRAFARHSIPYQFLGPGQLFRQEEIKDLIAYLKVLANFEDNVSFYRLLIMPIWQISGRDLAEIVNYSRKNNVSLFETCEKNVETPRCYFGASLQKITEMIHRHLERVKTETAGQILYYFLEDTGLLKQLAEPKTQADEKRAQNIAKFFDKLKALESDSKNASVYAAVEWLDTAMELGESPLASDFDWTQENAVNILTVHSAKGLEFPVVFLVNLVEQRFPTRERREQIPLPDALIKELLPEGDSHLQEERRLFYVGLTRAKDQLYLTAADYYSEAKQKKRLSQFVKETLGENSPLLGEIKEKSSQQLSFLDFAPTETNLANSPNLSNLSNLVTLPVNYLSYSQIETFSICPRQYYYKYILRIPVPQNAAASFGNSLHATLRDFYRLLSARQILDNLSALLKLYDLNWDHVGYKSKAEEEKNRIRGQEMLEKYYRDHHRTENLPIAIEESFTVKINDNLKIGGKIDRLDKKSDKILEIVDYKTGRADKKDVAKDLQLTMYALAKEHLSMEIILSFHFLETNERISAKRTPEELSAAKTVITESAQAISRSDFSPAPGEICKYCEYRMLCPAYR